GLGRGDTIALMLSNRPEFHLCDLAAMMLGATPFSIYNTYAPNQIEYVVCDADARILICEQQFLPQVLDARASLPRLEHVILVDGDPPDGPIALAQVAGSTTAFHVAQRNAHHYLPIVYGLQITCCDDPRQVLSYLPEVRPSWFFAVPRIWEKLKAGLETMIAGQPEEQREATRAAIDACIRKV